jgi:predicted DNA-binding transcriptional regulator AlpA
MYTPPNMMGFTLREGTPQPTDTVLISVDELRKIIRDEVTKALGTHSGEEKLLSAKDAAKLMSVSPDWLYRNAATLPFARKLGRRSLRFSKKELEKYLNTRRTIQ